MKAAAVQKAMKAMKAMKAVKAMKAGAMKARKAMSAKKTTTEPEAIAGMRRIYAAQRTVFLDTCDQMAKIRKDASDGKKRQVSTKLWATCDMKEPAPMESNCCDVC